MLGKRRVGAVAGEVRMAEGNGGHESRGRRNNGSERLRGPALQHAKSQEEGHAGR